MIEVKCFCCPTTAEDSGRGGPTPFQDWHVPVNVITQMPGQQPVLNREGIHLCAGCRMALIAGDFAGLAAKNAPPKAPRARKKT